MYFRRAIPRQQRFVVFHGGRLRQAFQCVAQPRIGLLAFGFGRLDQAVKLRTGRRPSGRVTEKLVLSADDKRADRTLGCVVVDR